MARTVKDAALGQRESRLKLKIGRRYWRGIHEGLALGYRRPKSGSGVWCARIRVGRDEYRYPSLGTADDHAPANGADVLDFKQAQQTAIAASEAEKLADGTLPQALTVKAAVERYVKHLRAEKGDTAADDAEQRLNKHVAEKWGKTLVADLRLAKLQDWRNELAKVEHPERAKGQSESDYKKACEKADNARRATVNRVLANFKAALNLAFQDSKSGIATDQAWRALKGFNNVDRAREDHFEADDVQKLIDAAAKFDQPFSNLLVAGFLTGARYGELAACDVRHFDAKGGVLLIPSGKTGGRAVTLMSDATAFFKDLTQGRAKTEPLLPKADGERWGKSEQHRRIKRALKDAKLPKTASFYSLRHSYISRSIECDVPLFIVARNCGTSESMIRKHYAKLLAAKEHAMLERAAGAFKLTLIPGGSRPAPQASLRQHG
jgi:integrase